MNARTVIALIVGIALLVPGHTMAQDTAPLANPDFTAIDHYIEDQMADSRIPGVAVAIVEGDQIVHARGFGSAGDDRDVTPQTPFPMGSLIKSFTALAIMQLVEAGKVELDAPVQTYLPWFRVADPDASAQITVRHLLTQTSGLSRETGIKPLYAGGEPTLEELVRDLRTEELNRPVGTSYEYSNANFATAALIVETVSEEAFGVYLNRHILSPLGMVHSSALDDDTRTQMTATYQYWFGAPRPVENAYQPSRFAGEYLIASAEDMARYLAMYLGNGAYQGTTILSATGIEQMLAPATNESTRQLLSTDFTFRYALGWFAGAFGAEAHARWHLGELPYFNSWMVLQPERNRGVAVLINAGSQLEFAEANEMMSRIPLGVVSLLDGQAPLDGLGLTRFYVYFDLIVAAIVAFQVWALVRLVRRPTRRGRPQSFGQGFGFARRTVPLTWEFGLPLLLILGWPAMTGMGWRGSWMSFPDLTMVLWTVSALWLLTGGVRVIRLAQARFGKRRQVSFRPDNLGQPGAQGARQSAIGP